MKHQPTNESRACNPGPWEACAVVTAPIWALALAMALCALLGGCAPAYQGGPVVLAPAQPGPAQAQQDRIIDRAVARWASLGLPVYVGHREDVPLPVQFVAGAQAVSDTCGFVGVVGYEQGQLPVIYGCAPHALEDGRPLRIVIDSSLRPGKQADVLTHEIGHMLRRGRAGEDPHLVCLDVPGPDVMCPGGASTNQLPTARDVAFMTRAE
jgi:hypothetical protein